MADDTDDLNVGVLTVELRGKADQLSDVTNNTISLMERLSNRVDNTTSRLEILAQQSQNLRSVTAALGSISGIGSFAINSSPLQAVATAQQEIAEATTRANSAMDQQDAHIQRLKEFQSHSVRVDNNWESTQFSQFLQAEKDQERASERQTVMARQAEETQLSDLEENQRARISVMLSGTEREMAILKYRHMAEREARLKAGQDVTVFDETAALRERALQQKHEANEGGDEEGGTHMNHYMLRRLGFHAGQALGASGVGGDLTGIMAAFEGLSAPIAAATIGAIALASAYNTSQEHAQELMKSQISYNEELRKSQNHWKDIQANQLPSNDLSKLAREEAVKASDAWHETAKTLAEAKQAYFVGSIPTLPSWAKFSDTAFHNNATVENFAMDEAKIEHAKSVQTRLEAVQRQQEQQSRNNAQSDRHFAEESASIAAMGESPLKHRLALENEISAGRDKLHRENQTKLDTYNESMRQQLSDAESNADVATNAYGRVYNKYTRNGQATKGNQSTVQEASRRMDEALKALHELRGQQSDPKINQESKEAEASYEVIAEQKRNAEMRQERMQSFQQHQQIESAEESLRQATISANETGYSKEVALLKDKNASEAALRQESYSNAVAEGTATQAMRQSMIAANAAAYQRELEQSRSHMEQMRQITVELEEARIRSTSIGSDRQEQISDKQFEESQRQFAKDHHNDFGFNVELKDRQDAHDTNKQTARDDQIRTITDHQEDMANQILEITNKTASADREWLSIKRELTRELTRDNVLSKESADLIETQHQTFMKLKTAQESAGFIKSIKESGIQVDLINKNISKAEAAMQRAFTANPNLSPEATQKMMQSVNAQNHADAVQFAHDSMIRLHPALALEDKRAEIKNAYDQGGFGEVGSAKAKRAALETFKQAQSDVYGHQDSGQFNSSYTRGQVDFRGVNLNSQFGANKDRELENGKFLSSIDGSLKQIVKQRGIR